MIIKFEWNGKEMVADLSKPNDISIPLKEGSPAVNCFYAPPFEAFPVVAGEFVGSTLQGGPVNFLNIRLNPHGNGTHTECVGHIAKEPYTINQTLKKYFHIARLISVMPAKNKAGDRIIEKHQLQEWEEQGRWVDALVIRTIPNDEGKKTRNYSGTNPPYLSAEAAAYLNSVGVEHLLIDLPSIDREEDAGALAAHKAYWGYPENTRTNATISELVFVPDALVDGYYLLDLQTASFELDVSPGKPVLYGIKEV